MRLLFIKLLHIGDSLLMTPTCSAVKKIMPNAEIFVVVRKGSEEILDGCDCISRVISYTPIEYDNRNIKTFLNDLNNIKELRRYTFDYIFELTDKSRARWLSFFLKGRIKVADGTNINLNPIWKLVFNDILVFDQTLTHTVEKDYRIIKKYFPVPESPPTLQYSQDKALPIFDNIINNDIVVIRLATRWRSKEWPLENWVKLSLWLLNIFDYIIINTSNNSAEIEKAKLLQEEIGKQCIYAKNGMSFSELAYLLYHAKLYIGVDTVTTHLSAACGCPTVAFYGMSDDRVYGPWKVKNKVIAMPNRNLNQAFKTFETNDYMTGLSVDKAKADISDLLCELKQLR